MNNQRNPEGLSPWTTIVCRVGLGVAGAAALAFGWSAPASSQHQQLRTIASDATVLQLAAAGKEGKHRSRYRGRSVRRSFSFGFGYPYYGYPYYAPYGGYWGWGYSPRAVDYYGDDYAALDLDIKPEEAEIYLDGERIGIADNYDGFPRYLWLEEGTYNLVIYHEGYETLGKRIDLEGGGVLRLKDKMVPGEAKSPEELYAQLGPLPQTERRERVTERREGRAPLAPWRYRDRDGEESEAEEAPRSRRAEREAWRERRSAVREPVDKVASDLRSQPSKLTVEVTPADAVIYLNGELVGSAADIAALEGPLLIDAGRHKIEVSRPGYQDKSLEIEVAQGESSEVKVDLVKQ